MTKEEILKKHYEHHRTVVIPDENWAEWETCQKDGTTAMVYDAMDEYATVASQEHREEVDRLKARVKELEDALRNTVKVYSLMNKKTCESMGLDDPETFKAFLHAKSLLRTPPTK